MHKKVFLLLLLVIGFLLCPKDTYAYSSANYKNRTLCGKYEVASVKSNGTIKALKCFNVFEDAQKWMRDDGAEDLVVFHKLNGKTIILDANMALVDLSTHSGTLNFYKTKETSAIQFAFSSELEVMDSLKNENETNETEINAIQKIFFICNFLNKGIENISKTGIDNILTTDPP